MTFRSVAAGVAEGSFALPSIVVAAPDSASASVRSPGLFNLLEVNAVGSAGRSSLAVPICCAPLLDEDCLPLSSCFPQPHKIRQAQRIPTAMRIAHLAIEEESAP